MLSRRHAILTSGAFLVLAACGRGGGGADTLRVGSQKGGTKALMLAARALDGAPYKVEWSDFPAAQNLLEALGSDAVDVGLVGDAPFQFAYQSGSPARAVAATQSEAREAGALALVVSGNSPVHSIRDLVGKRVATTRGSIGHYLVLRALAAAGLPPDAVRLTFLNPSDSRAALQTGAIDGWSTWAPYTAVAMAEGARIVVDGRDFSPGIGFDVASESAIAGKRAILADFLQREAKALEWANAHVDDYARILSGETGLPLPIAQVTVRQNRRRRAAIDAGLIARQQVILDTFRNAGEFTTRRPITDAFAPI
ncbi:ABC transporter substrate-binding protein [Novosphingobium sp. KCTC 2891]|uniref:ABC transporter substrate-binding protein n=1 Tax=Novosphingobium sp. KCTC 2891 TaxID=2989730 RepID=UPI002223C28A|nr:ABC transporter substrate-binding protein [Novosphingobium sp. KCTC 2891]MCW1383551.1 ABC transporter substrate-binding protein [Novosphingobium sp. KCTC 2891]